MSGGAVNFVVDCSDCGMKCSGDKKKTNLWVKLHMKKAHRKDTYTSSKTEHKIETATKNGNPRPFAMVEAKMSYQERLDLGLEP
jgi:hypothetical protein